MINGKQLLSIVFGFVLAMPMASAFVMWTAHADGEIHEYSIVYSPNILWTDANTASADYGTGWHLATITSADEQNFLEANLFSNIDPTTGHKFWLGAYQDAGATDALSGWNWVTGEAWDFTSWGDGVNTGGSTYGEEYLFTTSYLAWDWDDALVNGRIYGYILERSGDSVGVPEPGTLLLLGAGLAGLGFAQRRKAK